MTKLFSYTFYNPAAAALYAKSISLLSLGFQNTALYWSPCNLWLWSGSSFPLLAPPPASLHLLSTSPYLPSAPLPFSCRPFLPSSPFLSSRSSHLLSCYGLDLKRPNSLHIDPQLPEHFKKVVRTFRNESVRVDAYCYVIPGPSTSLFPAN